MTLHFGFGVADITPDHPTYMFGFAPRTGLTTGMLDPLEARCLLFTVGERRVALVSLDLGGVPAELPGLLEGRLPADIELITCATHTHSGPQILTHAWYAPVSPDYLISLADRVVACVAQAAAASRPAELAVLRAPTEGIAFNRREADGPIDRDAVLLALVSDGELASLWVNYACHPVTIGMQNTKFSADFPGYARRALESRLNVPVIYTTGCCGQINLGHKPSDSLRGLNQHLRSREQAERIGTALADAILARLDPGLGETIAVDALSYERVSWPATYEVPGPDARAQIGQAARSILDDPQSYEGDRAVAVIDIDWLNVPHWGGSHNIGVLQLGPVSCAFLSDEIFVEAALSLPADICVSYAYSNLGYVIPTADEGGGGYEVDVAWRIYGAPGPFASGTGQRVEDTARALLEKDVAPEQPT